MIKGCQKNIIFLKDTGSALFDEAYLVVKPSATAQREKDIVMEASRLINGFCDEKKTPAKEKGKLLPFLAGLGVGFTITLIFCLIFI